MNKFGFFCCIVRFYRFYTFESILVDDKCLETDWKTVNYLEHRLKSSSHVFGSVLIIMIMIAWLPVLNSFNPPVILDSSQMSCPLPL